MLILRCTWIRKNLKTILAGIILALSGQAVANECLDLLPYDTVTDGLPKICQSTFNGINNSYSCQDYRSGETRYRVLYRGGLSPKAVIQLNPDSTRHLISAPIFGDRKLRCPLTPPAGIPKYSVHRGIGVCQDDDDQMVSCSVFEYAAARQTEAHRFMTFYTNDHERLVTIDAQIAGTNSDAMVAEMTYQIGMSLWDTECCSELALKYLEYAYQLFPQAEAYRNAYRHSRVSLALREIE